MKLLDLLLLFLRPGVEGEPDPAPDPAPDSNPAPDPAPDPSDDLDVEADPAPEPDKGSPEAEQALAEIRAERARADRFERELAEIKGRQSQPRSPADLTQEEESILKDEKADPMRRWQVQANVELRRGRNEAQLALAQAQDIADKTSFSRIANTNPTLYKRYETRVEEELAKMRSRGFNASREAIMDNLIGKDMREGKFAKKKPAEEPATGKKTVDRGRLPGARSDVSGRNAMSEHEKRRQRLENQQI